jgi:septin family protein
MKRLSPRVNVIPVIGKADSLTPAELAETKKLVMEDIEHYRIPVYNFPYDIEEDDEDTVEENAELRGLMPFAIVGSEDTVEIGGRVVRARQYPWGLVEVDNPRHSDFLAIRSALLHSHLADLKEITHDFLYENYRTEKLSKSVEGGATAYVTQDIASLSAGTNGIGSDHSLAPEDLASQSVRLKEEQLRREEEKLKEIELKVQPPRKSYKSVSCQSVSLPHGLFFCSEGSREESAFLFRCSFSLLVAQSIPPDIAVFKHGLPLVCNTIFKSNPHDIVSAGIQRALVRLYSRTM